MARSTILHASVKKEGRFVQLELGPNERHKESRPFKFSIWKWKLSLRRDGRRTIVELSTDPLVPYITQIRAAVSLTFFHFPRDQNGPPTVHHPPALDDSFRKSFSWTIAGVSGRCLAVIAFGRIQMFGLSSEHLLWPSADMLVWSPIGGGSSSTTVHMLHSEIFTDITINADGRSIRAHRAVLATWLSVFESMFTHDFREKALSEVDIPDMSIDACRAFIGYLYSNVPDEDLVVHREELVAASNKYGIDTLKSLCERSLSLDIDAVNVLERLQIAHLYQLRKLKFVCIRLLVEFRMMFVISDDFNVFLQVEDPDLVVEIKGSYPKVWQPKHKSSSNLDSDKAETSGHGDAGRAKRARRRNVRLAGDEWA